MSELEKSGIVNLYKEVGETPFECMARWRSAHPELEFAPMTYAGRLDPMAEGLILVLYGDKTHEKNDYLSFNKEYEFGVLFGFSTDTYDILGKVAFESNLENIEIEKEMLEETVSKMIGQNEMPYPAFSSRPVAGRPLFLWAKEGKLDEIKIPNHIVEIFSIKILENRNISKRELLDYIENKIKKVKGDFRQEEILKIWREKLFDSMSESFPVVKCIAEVGSGTYIRQIAHVLGEKLGISGLTFSIKRTKVGEYRVEDSERG